MKQRADEAFLLGGNSLFASVVEYSPEEAGLPGWVHVAGPHLNHCQPWWPLARGFFDYLGRCCFMLQSGRNVAQVAVYNTFHTGRNGLWTAPRDDRLDTYSKKFAFDFVNDDSLSYLLNLITPPTYISIHKTFRKANFTPNITPPANTSKFCLTSFST